MLSFQVTGLQHTVARLKGLSGKELERKTNLFLAKAVRGVVVPAVKAEENFKGHGKTPGLMKRKTTARKLRTRPGETAAYSVRARTFYAPMVIGGTKPHTIRAKGGSLAFGGIFATKIQHPGAKPNPFMERAARRVDSSSLAARLGKELMK